MEIGIINIFYRHRNRNKNYLKIEIEIEWELFNENEI